MLCSPERKRLEQDIKNIEACENNREKLSMRGYGNHPIYLDSSREFCLFFGNKKQGIMRCVCKCGFNVFVAECGDVALNITCPDCKSAMNASKTWTELAYIEVAYRSLQREKEILKNELARETDQAEVNDNRYKYLLQQEKSSKERLEVELNQEKEKTKKLTQQLEIIQQEKQELEAKIETTTK